MGYYPSKKTVGGEENRFKKKLPSARRVGTGNIFFMLSNVAVKR